ncbi:MAG: hypothetical protein N3A57_08270, partial [Negativicutes bacterium]|nr:hypothetical protein [Negativicutes bacterium]
METIVIVALISLFAVLGRFTTVRASGDLPKMHGWLDSERVVTIWLASPLSISHETPGEGFVLREFSGEGSERTIAIDSLIPVNLNSDEQTQLISIVSGENLSARKNYRLDRSGYASAWINVRNILNNKAYFYGGEDLGCTYSREKSRFKLWAPTALTVNLVLFSSPSDDEKSRKVSMLYNPDGVWDTEVIGDLSGYGYLYEVYLWNNGSQTVNLVPDPYSVASVANSRISMICDWEAIDAAVEGWATDQPVHL